MSSKETEARLAAYIKALAEISGSRFRGLGDSNALDAALTMREIARDALSRAPITRDEVSRALRDGAAERTAAERTLKRRR